VPETLDDAELIRQFEDTSLETLSHRDHIRLVYLFTLEGGADAAYERVRAGLIAFTKSLNAAHYFHETRTWAWARIVASATEADRDVDGGFDAFEARHPEFDRRDLLDDYYAPGVLDSTAAHDRVIAPTLRSL
jgi:hypothetical protein